MFTSVAGGSGWPLGLVTHAVCSGWPLGLAVQAVCSGWPLGLVTHAVCSGWPLWLLAALAALQPKLLATLTAGPGRCPLGLVTVAKFVRFFRFLKRPSATLIKRW